MKYFFMFLLNRKILLVLLVLLITLPLLKEQISSIFDTFNNAPGNYFNIASPNIQARHKFALCTHV